MTRSKLLPSSQCREVPPRPISSYESDRNARLRAEIRRDKIFFRTLVVIALVLLFVLPIYVR